MTRRIPSRQGGFVLSDNSLSSLTFFFYFSFFPFLSLTAFDVNETTLGSSNIFNPLPNREAVHVRVVWTQLREPS
ncbi:hypothetical protein LZ31DRAFT_558691 [Colletotrichum somersetense]|nr:hypothetical protein LZ31DRAFT_558691 [Colletotrichum somersetense]